MAQENGKPQNGQARQRLLQLENARLDSTWQATQAQADLLTALGAPTLIEALQRPANSGDSSGAVQPGPPTSPGVPGARGGAELPKSERNHLQAARLARAGVLPARAASASS